MARTKASKHHFTTSAAAALLLALAACGPASPVTPVGPSAARAPKPSGAPGEPTTSATTTTPPPLVATPRDPQATLAPPVVASLAPLVPGQPLPATAVLAGRVTAPLALVLAAGGLLSDKGAGILSNNGSSVVANNSSKIIANNGGGYRLSQATDVPLVSAIIRLEDASGQAVQGPDGKPVVTMTDASGNYAFSGLRPGRHLVVKAELPLVGSLARIVAPQVSDAPLDVASTLATTYIMERFVGSQADRQATLDRLPADVEAETVLAAGRAASGTTPLVTLASAEVVAKVEALRTANTAFDAQLEKVKQILILAGSSNLGAGELATTVALRRFHAIWPNPDGSVYLQVGEDGMLWRLDPDGRLRAIAGRAATGPGAAVTVGEAALVVDAKGRLVFGGALGAKLWRLTPGATAAELKVEDLTSGLSGIQTVCPLDGDDVLAFTWSPQKVPAKAWRLRAGQAPELLVTEVDGRLDLAGVKRAVRRPDGTVRVQTAQFIVPDIRSFDLATGVMTPVLTWSGALGPFLQLGNDGEAYYSVQPEDRVRRWVDGTDDPVVPDLLTADLTFAATFGIAADGVYVMGGGSAYSSKNVTLSRRKGGVVSHVAGLTGEAAASGPGVVTLTNPTAFAVEADGDLLVVDNAVLARVKPGGNPVTFGAGTFKDGETTFSPSGVYTHPARGTFVCARQDGGNLFTNRDAVFQLDGEDKPTLVFRGTGSPLYAVPGPDGGMLVAETAALNLGDFRGHVVRLGLQGQVTELLPSAKENANVKAWLDGGRYVYALPVYIPDKPTRYTPYRMENDGTVTKLAETDGAPLFSDTQGRTYTVGATIKRTDAATGITQILAGPGGSNFAGTGVDDGLGAASALQFGPEGDLYFLDQPNRQIKRIPRDQLR